MLFPSRKSAENAENPATSVAERPVPPIDLEVPAHLETATFAVG